MKTIPALRRASVTVLGALIILWEPSMGYHLCLSKLLLKNGHKRASASSEGEVQGCEVFAGLIVSPTPRSKVVLLPRRTGWFNCCQEEILSLFQLICSLGRIQVLEEMLSQLGITWFFSLHSITGNQRSTLLMCA